MSTNKRAFLGICFLILSFFFYGSTRVHAETFSRNLTIGDSGSDVQQLQVLLNQNYETRVAETGAGSPGYETTYFGVRTADAVRRFQELNRQSILIPSGLSAGTGFFGPTTRSFVGGIVGGGAVITTTSGKIQKNASITTINTNSPELGPDVQTKQLLTQTLSAMNPRAISVEEMSTALSDPNIVPETVASPTTTRAVVNLVENQNKSNVETFITLLDQGGYLNNLDEDKKDAVKEQIRTDSKKDIIELIRTSKKSPEAVAWAIPQAPKTQSLFPSFAATIVDAFTPKEALASGLLPFGGTIYYRYFCTASFTWLILIGPPGFLWPTLVGYTYAQGFAYWTMPFARFTIGLFVPGVQSCWIYVGTGAIPIPNMGVISYITGSTLF